MFIRGFVPIFACLLFVLCNSTCSFQKTQSTSSVLKKAESGGYTYQYVEGDPMNVRMYELANGLRVYLSRYEAAPNVYTNIAVKVGGKDDPADNTGLSHYLEHIMFKGTSSFGTIDWKKENKLLQRVEDLFETFKALTSEEARQKHYQLIDEVSMEASKYAIPNEYDKMISNLGGTSTNAYTSNDRTVYVNRIPSNQIEKWLEIEAERFQEIVPRLFHTELETVYEEKNRSLDTDSHKIFDTLDQLSFQEHPYGKQSVIGSVEHLKSPSITAIKKHFNTYYRPNNTAIIMSGELDYDEVITWIDKYFGGWKPNFDLPKRTWIQEAPLDVVRSARVYGPSPASVLLSFRMDARDNKTKHLVTIADMLLANSSVGLIDLNINQKQRAQGAFASVYDRNDYSLHLFGGMPRENQRLEEVKELLLGELARLKSGDFEEWLIEAIINDLERSTIKMQQSNSARCGQMTTYFSEGRPWKDYVDLIPTLRQYTKQDIITFAESLYKDNYAVVYKETGEDKNIQKVEKPSISKMVLNKENKSPFSERIMEKETKSLSPKFLDYEKDIENYTLENSLQVYAIPNKENNLFSLYLYYDFGDRSNPVLRTAMRYVQYLSPEGMTPETFQKELYKIGCSFNISVSGNSSYVRLGGLSKNIERGLQLVEDLMANPKANEEAFVKMIEGIKKDRENAKKNKEVILQHGLVNYALYGKNSPFTNVLSNEALDQLSATMLTQLIQDFLTIEHRILYYGPENKVRMTQLLNQYHQVAEQLKIPFMEKKFDMLLTQEPTVYWAHYDMVQTEMIFVSPQELYNPALVPEVTLFNEYFSGGMASIMFQELREARALAYSTYARYSLAKEKERYNIFFAYIGTQADKQAEAIVAVNNLLTSMPRVEGGFALAKSTILKKIESQRILRKDILFNYERAKKLGLTFDIRQNIYEAVGTMDIEALFAFQKKHIQGKRRQLVMIGNRESTDFENLKEYGKVVELSLEEIFGY